MSGALARRLELLNERYKHLGVTMLSGVPLNNTSGGLKSKGHPVGATGVAQICDIAAQIRGEAGERQLKRHSLGLAQNLGGSGATADIGCGSCSQMAWEISAGL